MSDKSTAKSISKNSLMLGVFALVTTAILALTAEFTKERVAKAEREAQQKALFEILPRTSHDNDLLTEVIQVPEDAWAGLGLKSGGEIHVARRVDDTVALIIPAVAPDGYSGEIKIPVGSTLTISPNTSVTATGNSCIMGSIVVDPMGSFANSGSLLGTGNINGKLNNNGTLSPGTCTF